FTYNDPIIWAEYAIDTARACRDAGVKSVAVTAGYISREARPAFFEYMDAANVDLKAFTEEFYEKVTYSQLQPVLETLRWLKHESNVWFEITNLVIPQANDSPDELRQMCDWILDSVGPDVPTHFSAFHPDFRMMDRDGTSLEKLLQAYEIAKTAGLNYVYVGNVNDVAHQSTWCPGCKALLIERNWHELSTYRLNGNRCAACGMVIPGHFDKRPGDWGRRRLPIRIRDYNELTSAAEANGLVKAEPVRASSVSRTSDPSEGSATPAKDASGAVMQSVQECPQLTTEQQTAIHRMACHLVTATALGNSVEPIDPEFDAISGVTVMGTFVTLKRNGALRSCCGSLGRPMPLAMALTESAVRTAKDDHRFPPIAPVELPFLTLDVTLLFNFEPIPETGEDRLRAIEIGRHGLRIQGHGRSGLLLPVVAIEQGWDSRQFLNGVCRKAGLPEDAWKDPEVDLLRFEGRMIEREFDTTFMKHYADRRPVHWSSTAEVKQLARFARGNILAQEQGAVPGCFPTNVSDGTVDGIIVKASFENPDVAPPEVFARIQLRGGLPLQMTLLQLTDAAARWLRQVHLHPQQKASLRIDLLLLTTPAMHGTAQAPDLSGFDSSRHLLMAINGRRSGWSFQNGEHPDTILNSVLSEMPSRDPAATFLYSFDAVSSADQISDSNAPKPQKGSAIRPPAVAGQFYPADVTELNAIVDDCLGDVPAEKEAWPGVMVPHAGLRYSGRIAGDVLKRIRIPKTVIIIGPKHTPLGMDWAVAPNEKWQIPGAVVESDLALARELVNRIDGLEFDSAAHSREHCIEVELPLLARVAPQAKIVGIAIGGGSIEQCRKFGQDLALLISEMEEPPLLMISSDMNHFADDRENRRLDEMALKAMESLDPVQLYQTVSTNGISMCGVLPAFIVMETLLCLDQLSQTQRTGYATSGEVTGDLSRVVGYAGMLLGPDDEE
ncbi:MAG: AmmeMemoRadiSam system radical SAM enzyme, partial [Planctomycetaceae bacterium]|nr:AmmeMemoRadiSam system radical SAM enzyme [Planctomycetaceae bacterium]